MKRFCFTLFVGIFSAIYAHSEEITFTNIKTLKTRAIEAPVYIVTTNDMWGNVLVDFPATVNGQFKDYFAVIPARHLCQSSGHLHRKQGRHCQDAL